MIPSDLAPRILVGHVLEQLRTLPDESVQCVVTSPPYWGLRAYGTEPQVWGGEAEHAHEWLADTCACGAWKGELGLEPTPDLFVSHLADVFDEARRVLRVDGILWLNLGDSYNGSGKGPTGRNGIQKAERRQEFINRPSAAPDLKPKDLVGVPWMAAFELRRRGWWLRSDCIWAKPNPMPESVADRPTRSHEYVFLLTKSERYFYDADAVRTAYSRSTMPEIGAKYDGVATKSFREYRAQDASEAKRSMIRSLERNGGANLRSVWWIPTQPYPEAHFATYPEMLPKLCIKASTRAQDVVLDPFCGSGTTLWVARQLGRRVIGIELNPKYAVLARRRCLAAVPDIETAPAYEEARA